jgi:hypothetical protein
LYPPALLATISTFSITTSPAAAEKGIHKQAVKKHISARITRIAASSNQTSLQHSRLQSKARQALSYGEMSLTAGNHQWPISFPMP